MKKIILLLQFFLIGFFVSVVHAQSNHDLYGYNIAKEITDNYFHTPKDCGDDASPAFLCSGVLLRGTVASDNYHSWNPSPHSQESGGVSFSYLRHDAKVIELADDYKNGFIFYPYNTNPIDNKISPEVLCYFPINGDTFYRSEKGCGSYIGNSQSVPCQEQGITTAQQWVQQYYNVSQNNLYQCGFNVRGQADAFMQGIEVRSLINLSLNNELILATWDQNIPEKLPISAFFYRIGGLQDAQHDQKDFYQVTGKVIPIILMNLPSDDSGSAIFSYNPEDQAVTP
ncbi:N-acyl homoserine lactonase [Xenorhabdus anantnagensis]|uniref:N-acyl homoserine lactonase n=1 Tax=Xenorhabdus anantnagensis TaxID=3025875 RepID=A0ABT5LMP8_9GAMM|nr:N-acyl homoserine lactonase [Xenorhabdus anantnagensis]MDC9595697.1 N-acyl homoserine lactonase [Xenorhabdus anantnagensis]